MATDPDTTGIDGHTKLAELPFDFQRRCLSVLVAGPDGAPQLITKGAPEAILDRSTQVRTTDGSVALDAAQRATILALIAAAAADGDRMVAVGSRTGITAASLEPADEHDLVFEGLLRFSDPPKADISATLIELKELRVGLKVITGDSLVVAQAVAAQVGLEVEGTLTGEEMAKLSPTAFAARAERATIFARVDPDRSCTSSARSRAAARSWATWAMASTTRRRCMSPTSASASTTPRTCTSAGTS